MRQLYKIEKQNGTDFTGYFRILPRTFSAMSDFYHTHPYLQGNKKRRRILRRPKQYGAIKRRCKKDFLLKYADERRIRGDSQSGSAANAPIRSALSLVFLPSSSELFGGCLTCDAKRRTCYKVKHPPKCHLIIF